MVVAEPSHDVDRETQAAAAEKKKLRKQFGPGDMFFFYVAAVVLLDTAGQVAGFGAQGFTWLVVLGVLWFVPFALVTAELGSAFPEEGGPYVWARRAFGRLIGSMTGLVYWVSVPLWVGGSLTIVSLAAFNQYFPEVSAGWRYVYGLAFIWFAVGTSIVGFRLGKWIVNLGGVFRIVVLAFFSVSVVLYGVRHGVHGVSGADFAPSYVTFIAVVPVLLFNFTGLELGSTASEEMINPQRDVPRSIVRAVVTALVLYGLPVIAILVVLPVGEVSGLTGFLDAVRTVFTVYGGSVSPAGVPTLTGAGLVLGQICCLLFMFGLLTAGSSWLIGGDRALAIACADGAGPAALGRFSARTGTPIRVNVLSGVVATVTMILAFRLTGDNPNKYFEAVLGLTISTSLIAYLGMFPAVVELRYSHPDVSRPFRIGLGNAGAWVCGTLTTFWCLLGTLVLVWPGLGVGWFGTGGDPDEALDQLSFGGHRLEYELTQIVPLVAIALLGFAFYRSGRDARQALVGAPSEDGAPRAEPAGVLE